MSGGGSRCGDRNVTFLCHLFGGHSTTAPQQSDGFADARRVLYRKILNQERGDVLRQGQGRQAFERGELESQRDSFYHTNALRTSFYSTRPNCEYPYLFAVVRPVHIFVPAPSFGDEMGVVGSGGDARGATLVIPSRLQVFLSRELFGWPLYGLILAFGQVHRLFSYVSWVVTTDCLVDVERDQLSNRLTLWFERADRHPVVHPWLSLLRCFGCLVPALPSQAFDLGPLRSVVLLRCRLPPHRPSLRSQQLDPCA